MIEIVLLLVAVLLAVILFPIGFLIAMCFHGRAPYLRAVAICIDQMGNVVMAPLFNRLFITKAGYRFGNVEETISSVVGKNARAGTLTPLGKRLDALLSRSFGKNHSIDSIEEFPPVKG